MATQVIGTIAVNNILPIQARAAGAFAFGPFAVPAGYTGVSVLFDLQQVTSLTAQFTAALEMSTDGVTFASIGSYGLDLALSGYRILNSVLTRAVDDPLGPGPVRYFGSQIRLTQTDLATRQVRGTVTCSEALISGVTVVGM